MGGCIEPGYYGGGHVGYGHHHRPNLGFGGPVNHGFGGHHGGFGGGFGGMGGGFGGMGGGHHGGFGGHHRGFGGHHGRRHCH